MQTLYQAILLLALVPLVLGMASAAIERAWITVPMLATLVGIVAGPQVAGWIDPQAWPQPQVILREAARITIAVSVLGIAIRTPPESYRRAWRPALALLTLGMAGMWAMSSAVSWAALGLGPAAALLLGAILTPTDPVTATSIVTGPFAEQALPDRLRSTLSLESGANDGLGYLFVMLPMTVIEGRTDLAFIWLVDVLLHDVLGAVAIGAALGWLTAQALRLSDRHGLAEQHSFHGLTIALSLAALALGRALDTDGVLAAFAAGASFCLSADRREDFEEQSVQETISKLMNVPIFTLFGLTIPWGGWAVLGWPLWLLLPGVLLLRRLPVVLALRPWLKGFSRQDTIFAAWFGPIGVAAIFYGLDASLHTGDMLFWHAASAMVAASLLVHGITAAPGLRAYGRGEGGGAGEGGGGGEDRV